MFHLISETLGAGKAGGGRGGGGGGNWLSFSPNMRDTSLAMERRARNTNSLKTMKVVRVREAFKSANERGYAECFSDTLHDSSLAIKISGAGGRCCDSTAEAE
jgi:hypothetical protein